MAATTARGRCLCGAVEFETLQLDGVIGACHCSICRTWSGGALLAVGGGGEVEFTGEDKITVFASSARATRGFCSVCGTHLFVRVTHDGRYLIPPGLLEGGPALRFDHQIFIDRKPAYYSFADDTRNLTAAEVLGGVPPQ